MPHEQEIEVLMPPAIRPAFETWLASRGLEIVLFEDMQDELPLYMVVPTAANMAATRKHFEEHGQ